MKHIIHVPIAISLFFAVGCNNHPENQNKMETEVKTTVASVDTAISKDGTSIAYEKTGSGPNIILINGALAHRKSYAGNDLPARLSKDFTVIIYDRRGRGESGDTKPYSVEKEIEDIEAIIDETGGSAHLFGSSSGAALALLAAERLGPKKVTQLALYEPPYGSGTKGDIAKEKQKIRELIGQGKPAEAISFFMEKRGTPPDKMEEMKKSPAWNDMVRTGHTLVYDFEVLGDGTIPAATAKNIAVPTLVMNGDKSFDFMSATADSIGKTIPGALRKSLKDQGHNASAESLAPLLLAFFGSRP
ncbi:MAG: alpha/beta hydrolase [Bacteroidota bacterium]